MFGAVFIVTIAMGIWIWIKMKKIKKVLLEEQEERRVRRMQEEVRAMDEKERSGAGAVGWRAGDREEDRWAQPSQPYGRSL